jgi:dihydroorotase
LNQPKIDLLITGGRVFDLGRQLDDVADVAVNGRLISEIGRDIDPRRAANVVDASGALVVPGLIDLHTHVAGPLRKIGEDDLYLEPDIAGVLGGVTTVVDAGSVGAYNLGGFARFVVPACATRVISFIHAGTLGIFHAPEIKSRDDIDVEAGIEAVLGSGGLVRGVKVRMVGPAVAVLGAELPKLAKEIANGGGVPLMVHVGDYITHNEVARKLVPVLLDDILEPGDIVTHATSHQIGSLLDEDGNVLATARRARERGVIFDAGVGIRNFTFKSARVILGQGFVPDTISSDLTVPGRQSPTHSLTECMNKFMALGLSLEDVVLRTTARPAEVLGMSEQLGSISPGREADLSILEIVDGDWIYRDNFGGVLRAQNAALAPRLTVRAGRVFKPAIGPRPWGWLPERAG